MEHQKLDKNLKSTKVFTSCHIYGLLFYGQTYVFKLENASFGYSVHENFKNLTSTGQSRISDEIVVLFAKTLTLGFRQPGSFLAIDN
jgi:hypothetical protein